MNTLTLEVLLQGADNRVLDFGPPLNFPEICPGYTVEKLSLWEHTTEDKFEVVAVQSAYLAKARAEGTLYNLTDDQVFKLDKIRGNGVVCERKKLPIYVATSELCTRGQPKMLQTLAWVYIAHSEHWVYQIKNGAAPSTDIVAKGYRLMQQVLDPNPVLNQRFCFLPPPYDAGRVGTPTPKMLKHIRRKNKAVSREMFFINMRRRLKIFVNDE